MCSYSRNLIKIKCLDTRYYKQYLFISLQVPLDLASLFWSLVMKEPIVCIGSAGADNLIDHLCVGVVWEPQTEALFDIREVDTDAWS